MHFPTLGLREDRYKKKRKKNHWDYYYLFYFL